MAILSCGARINQLVLLCICICIFIYYLNNKLSTDVVRRISPISAQDDSFFNLAEVEGTVWQGSKNDPKVLFYSAIYDDRRLWMDSPVIVVLCLLNNTFKTEEIKWTIDLVEKDRRHTVGVNGIVDCFHFKSIVRETHACIIPLQNNSTNIPASVSVLINGFKLIQLPVFQPPHLVKKRNINICFQSVYFDNITTDFYKTESYLLQWVELQRLLGVDHITMYNFSITRDWNRALRHYVDEGFIDVFQTGPTDLYDPLSARRMQQHIIISDCMYRNMHSYRYTMVVDLDEVIVPYMDDNLPDMMDRIAGEYNLTESDTTIDFKFKNSFFFTEYPYPDNEKDVSDVFLRYRRRKDYEKETLPTFPKSISRPDLCLLRMAHYCMQWMESSQERPTITTNFPVIVIPPEIGNVHQYRGCYQPKNIKTKPFCLQYFVDSDKQDDRLLDFEKELQRNILSVREAIGRIG